MAVAGKSTSDVHKLDSFPPNPNSQLSTTSTVVREIEEKGNIAIGIVVDSRNYQSVESMVRDTVHTLGRLDVVVYNSGAIWWASVAETPFKRFQLMQRVNVEGLYGTVQACLPQFASNHGRIIVVSPPIYSRFFRGKTAYAMGKVGMSVLTKGLAMDFEREGKRDMAITSVWPAVAIESGATRDTPQSQRKDLRKPGIFSEAILQILKTPPAITNGLITTDEDFLRDVVGYSDEDIDKHNLVPGSKPRRIMPTEFPDLKVAEHDDEGIRRNSAELRKGRDGDAKL